MKKQSVKLRQRVMPSGNISLYLDIYAGGTRTYEYLHLYLHTAKTRQAKEENRQTMQLAEAIAAKRLVEVRNGQYGFKSPVSVSLRDYVQRIIDTKNGSTKRRYDALNNILQGFCRNSMMLADITPAWFSQFLTYLDKQGYARNTLAVYVATMRYIINQAHREGLLPANPIANIKGIGYEETNRTYLTADEVRRLADTPCDNDVTKRAFLFGCLTGIRNCDIRAITWADVHEQDGYTRIIFRQAKTHGQEYLDISAQASSLMGGRGRDNDAVFPLMSWHAVRLHLKAWVKRAKIAKHVTFHASRHTFAVMMLDVTDIYTVSKLLGHRELSTTQVYAKVLDKAKREAVDRMPDLLNTEKSP
ncbi:MAG: site-specific integrase [Alistipes sp.]|nr:site-specific integrase [Alistipes sp.]